jgi:UDP:flavonoid glycosyltransferase YjiC (YdhE family)
VARITLSTTGSLGDVLPFLSVGGELRARGHAVRFLLPSEFHSMVAGDGYDVAPAGFEISPRTLRALGKDWSRAGGLVLMRSAMNELVIPAVAEAHEVMLRAAADSDLLVTHANQIAAQMVAEQTGVRWAVISLFPMVFPTTEGLLGAPLPELPGPLRVPGQRAALAVMLRGSGLLLGDRALNRFRREQGLPPRRGYFMGAALSADRVVVPVPDFVAPRPTDWPDNICMTSFCPGALPGATVPADVDRFLADGPPPVVVTLGSALSTSTTQRLEQIGEILDRLGVRALFLVGQDPLTTTGFQDRPGAAAFAPLASVLPRCRAIIHHGGYGTTAAALGVGVPSVVTPFMPDQQWYGHRIEAIGAGVVVAPRRLTRALPSAVEHVLAHEHELQAKTKGIADRLEHLDGVATTADTLEDLLA